MTEPSEVGFLDFDPIDHTDAIPVLTKGEVSVLGRLPGASNATLAVSVAVGDDLCLAVYKPAAGERPLHDFPLGSLPQREVATYALSETLGWHLVPPTVLRADAPFGDGSLQVFVPHDPAMHAFTLYEEDPVLFPRIVVLDVLANNADRKAGHVIRDTRTSRLWAIDNGLTFHADPKLRTVLWPFAGRPLEPELIDDLRALEADAFKLRLAESLTYEEAEAFAARLQTLLTEGCYPEEPDDRYPYPWPPI